MSGPHVRSATPLDAGPRVELTAVRNICSKCNVRWWSGNEGALRKCPQCGVTFGDRDLWKAQKFVPERLVAAREARGLEVAELVAKCALPIADFEAAAKVPSSGDILLLSRALAMPPPWFSLPPRDDARLDGPTFWCETPVDCDTEDCFERSVALCDYPVAGGGTCDAKMCPDHGKRVGDDTDYCEKHARREGVA